jgi:hypothetical protein
VAEILNALMHKLMLLKYFKRSIPEQWLVAKTIPVYKNKGNMKYKENCKPIANLYSLAKFLKNQF